MVICNLPFLIPQTGKPDRSKEKNPILASESKRKKGNEGGRIFAQVGKMHSTKSVQSRVGVSGGLIQESMSRY